MVIGSVKLPGIDLMRASDPFNVVASTYLSGHYGRMPLARANAGPSNPCDAHQRGVDWHAANPAILVIGAEFKCAMRQKQLQLDTRLSGSSRW